MPNTAPSFTTYSWPHIAVQLVSRARAIPGYCSPESSVRGIPVFLGPGAFLTSDAPGDFLCIGWPGAMDVSTPSGQSSFEVGAIAPNRPREEKGTVLCKAFSSSGGSREKDVIDVLSRASRIVSDIDVMLRTDPGLGLSAGVMQWCFMADQSTSIDVQGGAVVEIEFTLEYAARMAAQSNLLERA